MEKNFNFIKSILIFNTIVLIVFTGLIFVYPLNVIVKPIQYVTEFQINSEYTTTPNTNSVTVRYKHGTIEELKYTGCELIECIDSRLIGCECVHW